MAWVGKDGKDDCCKLASLGGAQLISGFSSLSAVSSTRFHRVQYNLTTDPSQQLINKHIDFIERLTLVGFVDGYGGNDNLHPFVDFQTNSPQEASALANASPLVIEANAETHVKSLDLTATIWK